MNNYIKEIVPKYIGKAKKGPKISQADQVVKFLNSLLKTPDQEHFIGLYLDGANQIITYSIISIGLLNSCPVHPREVFRPAILCAARAVIVAHNHPSGNLIASEDDLKVTRELAAAGSLMKIPLLDHIIFNSNNEHNSLNEKGLM